MILLVEEFLAFYISNVAKICCGFNYHFNYEAQMLLNTFTTVCKKYN